MDTTRAAAAEQPSAKDCSTDFVVEEGSVGADGQTAAQRESDRHRLAQRQKQIDFGKNTLGYEYYIQAVPKHKRSKHSDPQTPDIYQVCSKRSFDGQVKAWRRGLHKYDPNYTGDDNESPTKHPVSNAASTAVTPKTQSDLLSPDEVMEDVGGAASLAGLQDEEDGRMNGKKRVFEAAFRRSGGGAKTSSGTPYQATRKMASPSKDGSGKPATTSTAVRSGEALKKSFAAAAASGLGGAAAGAGTLKTGAAAAAGAPPAAAAAAGEVDGGWNIVEEILGDQAASKDGIFGAWDVDEEVDAVVL